MDIVLSTCVQIPRNTSARLYDKNFEFCKKLSNCLPKWLHCPAFFTTKVQTSCCPRLLSTCSYSFRSWQLLHRQVSLSFPVPRAPDAVACFPAFMFSWWHLCPSCCPFQTSVVHFVTDCAHGMPWVMCPYGMCHLQTPSLLWLLRSFSSLVFFPGLMCGFILISGLFTWACNVLLPYS